MYASELVTFSTAVSKPIFNRSETGKGVLAFKVKQQTRVIFDKNRELK